MHEIFKVLIFASTAFFSLYIFARLLGKKQIAQLNFVDYVIGISMGSIAADMAFDVSDTPFYYYIIAMAVFFLLDMVLSFISRKGPFMKRLFNGRPSVFIYEGKLDYKSLKKSGIDVNDLLSMLREQGYFDIQQVYYAILEPSGQLSVMPIGAERPAAVKDLPIEAQQPQLPNYLIIDGNISRSGLNELGKSEEWLYNELEICEKKDLKRIILASYDSQNNKVVAHYKNEESLKEQG